MFTIDKNHPLLDTKRTAPILKLYTFKSEDAAKRGIGFDLNLFDFTDVMQQTHCSYTGVKLDFEAPAGNPLRPSFERINPLDGYNVNNTVLTTFGANRCKGKLDQFIHDGAMTLEQKIKIMNRVIYRLKKQMKAEATTKNESLVSD